MTDLSFRSLLNFNMRLRIFEKRLVNERCFSLETSTGIDVFNFYAFAFLF